MPYIIETRNAALEVAAQRACDLRISNAHDLCTERDSAVSRTAVATLDEARAYLTDGTYIFDGPGLSDHLAALRELPESGGTIGPLPDGTVIEVRPIEWNEIVATTGRALTFASAYTALERAEILSEFNVMSA